MYVVDGFEFQTKEEARQAKKESDGIRYIKDQTDMSDPDTVYKLYLRLNKPGYFFTPVGYRFLLNCRNICIQSHISRMRISVRFIFLRIKKRLSR